MYDTLQPLVISAVDAAYRAAFPNVPIVYGNDPFDWNNAPETFVTLEVIVNGGRPIGSNADPKTRYPGYVYVCAQTRAGAGSGLNRQIITWFITALKYRAIGAMRLQEPEPDTDGDAPAGWYSDDLKVSFYADEP